MKLVIFAYLTYKNDNFIPITLPVTGHGNGYTASTGIASSSWRALCGGQVRGQAGPGSFPSLLLLAGPERDKRGLGDLRPKTQACLAKSMPCWRQWEGPDPDIGCLL